MDHELMWDTADLGGKDPGSGMGLLNKGNLGLDSNLCHEGDRDPGL